MSATIYAVDFMTKVHDEELCEILNRHTHPNTYTDEDAQLMVDDIESIMGWVDVSEDENNNSTMIWSMDDEPSMVTYKGREYKFYIEWNQETSTPFDFILVPTN